MYELTFTYMDGTTDTLLVTVNLIKEVLDTVNWPNIQLLTLRFR